MRGRAHPAQLSMSGSAIDGSSRRLGRKARSGIDRTPYKTDRKISFVSYHTRSISMNITRAEAWQLHKAVNTAKGDLCRHRNRNPTGGA